MATLTRNAVTLATPGRLATRTHLFKRSAPTILASFLFVAEPAAWPQPPLDLSHFNFHSPIPSPFPDLTTDSHIYERFMPKANFMEKRIVLASLLPVCMCLLCVYMFILRSNKSSWPLNCKWQVWNCNPMLEPKLKPNQQANYLC